MQNALTSLIMLALMLAIGAVLFVATTKVVNYSLEQETIAAEEMQLQIDEVLARESFSLSDFVEKFGEPNNVNTVNCAEERCIKARWDLSTRFVLCWKKLEVVLNEDQQSLYYYEVGDLLEVEVQQNGQDVILCLDP